MNLLKKEIDEKSFLLGTSYSNLDGYFSDNEASSKKSPFWKYLKNHFTKQGTYISDSVYVIPAISNYKSGVCDLESKLLILENTAVFSNPNSEVVDSIAKNRIIMYDSEKTIEGEESLIWFYLPEIGGYVKNSVTWDIFYSDLFYFEHNDDLEKWTLSEVVRFD